LEPSRLRIHNVGSRPIAALWVYFPDTYVEFGDVDAGASTDHRDVRGGVYRYSAFEFVDEGRRVTQSVTDFVGERPMHGSFTYAIEYVAPSGAEPGRIEIRSVRRD
jgi:hypothetical protein